MIISNLHFFSVPLRIHLYNLKKPSSSSSSSNNNNNAFLYHPLGFATAALAQNISFEPGTGTRSLWIPFKTATNLEASILNNSGDKNNQTTYVVSCATPAPQCDIGPNLTLTQGPTTAMYRTENAAGWADLRCSMNGTESAVCKNLATDSSTNFFERRTTTLTEKQPYVAVHVTATMDDGDDETPATASASATAEPTETDD